MARTHLIVCLLALTALAPATLADVIVVDEAGGGDFTAVQDALDAAADGDIVLVRPGDYSGLGTALFVSGKALSIVGDVGGEVRLNMLRVTGLPAGSTFFMRNLTFEANAIVAFLGATVVLDDNDGVVFVEDCVLEGYPGFANAGGSSALSGFDGVRVSHSAGAAFQRCTLLGGAGASTYTLPFPAGSLFVSSRGGLGARVQDAQAAFYDCVLTGGDGGSDFIFDAGGSDGGDALAVLDASRVTLSGTVVTGGDGGDGCNAVQGTVACRGGDGLVLAGSNPFVEDLDDVLAGGAGGDLDEGGQAADGNGVDAPAGTLFPHAGRAVGFHKTAPVRTGETATLTVTGPAGRLFGVFFSFGAGYLPKLGFSGVFQPGIPFAGPILIDVMPPSETYSVDYVAPPIAPFGLEGYVTIDQVLMDQGPDGLVASSASSHVQVDTGF